MQKILVRGPALSQSGYGEHTRFVIRSLREIEDKVEIFVIPVGWGNTGWIWEDDDERRWLDATIEKTITYARSENPQPFDVSIQVTIPNEWEKLAPVNIGVTAGIETTKVSPVWIEKAALMDKIVTISEHSKNVYEGTSYEAINNATGEKISNYRTTTPMHIVHYPVKDIKEKDIELALTTDFNFLAVAQWGPRKNVENTIRWFVEEFIDQEVGLVVKLNLARNCYYDRELCESRVKDLLSRYPQRKCKVYLLHGYMTEGEMSALYLNDKIKAYVTLTHGEGFGLPIFESAYHGLPVVAPAWSGHVDFLYMPVKDKKGKTKNKKMFADVDYHIEQVPKEVVWDDVIIAESGWCSPEQGSYKMRLREVYKDYGRFKKLAKQLREWVEEKFEKNGQYMMFYELVYDEDVANMEDWLAEFNVETHE